jgi:glycosyltransferase involved in cell wall biosynthesis
MDAQGVSMCEAMSCGLIVASSFNTAIPEFIHDHENGLLGSNPAEIASKIDNVESSSQLKKEISTQASTSMKAIDISRVLDLELRKLKGLMN